ncbi:pentatricopeptide repeat-containing protein At1g30610, chloroplastic [Argentina anserina]|uniref:pentatricopeptide repeat-containing protein At1g30610, chloroplastic n=1 Tax=Argentina anserina TaxID=57926 RepID=UPI002176328B|nr:pentatricopeptide repeat-containing protein At1g30610, chloroplastic [Potentilla anserina]
MELSNGQVGFSYFHRNGILATNCSQKSFPLSGFSISGRPFFGVGLNEKNVKKSRVSGVRTVNCGSVVSALAKEGTDNRSVGSEILEKDCEFKPSFDQCLEVMGSVKLRGDRDNKSRPREDNPKHSMRSRNVSRGFSSETDEEDVRWKESERHLDKRNVSKVAKLYENDNGSTEQSKRLRVRGYRDEYDSRQSDIRGDTRDGKWSRYTGRLEQELDYNSGKSALARNAREGTRDYKSIGQDFERRKSGDRSEDGHERYRISAEKGTADRRYSPRSGNSTKGERDSPRHDHDERAAFKYFDEYNDTMHRPRVSQVQMEERIQKLAKSLNGANIDIPEWMFSKMMRSAQIIFTDHSILRVIQILGKFGNWRRVLQVIEWLQMRERFKSHKLRYIYTTALDVLGKARRPVEALNVFQVMLQQLSSYPDLVAYHSIAITLGQAGHMKELFDVIDTMRSPPKKKFKTGTLGKWDPRLEPDLIVYNAVLNACVQRKHWEGAFWVLEQLKKQGLQPTTTTYGLVMEVMYACGKYKLVHEFFKKMQKSSVPNALTYRVIVKTLWRENKIDEAVQTVSNMERRGIVGSAALYYDFARCLCSGGRCQEALMQIEKICKVANKPLVVTYTGLIQACLDAGSIENGAYVFNQMENFCSPNLVTCNVMLKGYLDHGMYEEAKMLFQKMLEDGFHSKSGYELRVTPDIYTFNTLLEACITEKRWDDFEAFYKRMLQSGYNFNVKRHLRMILDGWKAGKGELLDITWLHLTKADRIPPPALIKERFCKKLEEGNYSVAISCIAKTNPNDLHTFSKTAWLNLFKENAERFQKDTLVQLVHEISILTANSDAVNPVFENLMMCCREFDRDLDRTSVKTGNFKSNGSVYTVQTEPAYY